MKKMKLLCSQFQTDRQTDTGRPVQRMRNIIVILALFVCTSICLGQSQTIYITKNNTHGYVYGNGFAETGETTGHGEVDKAPRGNTVNITTGATSIGRVYGAYMNDDSKYTNGTSISGPMTGNKVNVYDINHGCGDFENNDIYGACSRRTTAVEVNNNKVEISGGTKIKDVYGGYIDKNGTVSSNTVTISSSVEIGQNVYGGYIKQNGTATLNEVHLTSVTVSSDVFGARIGRDGDMAAGDGLVSSNTVTIISGAVKNVYGGYVKQDGTATLNEVHLTSVTVTGGVFGAFVLITGYVSSNTVTINGGKVEGRVFGGYIALKGTATLNEVNLTSVTVTNDVFGAKIGNGLARDNRVTIKGGKMEERVFGGFVGDGTATLNKVELTSVTVSSDVYGAACAIGYVSSNTVTIKGGKMEGCVFGGYVVYGTAIRNKVDLTSVTVTKDIFGGKIGTNASRIGRFGSGLASSNTVTITSGTVENVYGGYIGENGKATLNEVNLTSVTVTKDVYGAWIRDGLARDNKVRIDGNGKIEGCVFGGFVYDDGTATLNTVNLTSVTVSSDVYGARIGYKYGNGSGLASSNTVTINGGKIEGNVFGGYVGGNGKAIYNTITITGKEQSSPEFSTTTILCGGICADADTNDAFTGNTLNIATKGVEVNGISNFENYNFYLKGIKSGETILTAMNGGCSWDVVIKDCTSACEVDLSRSNIYLRTQIVINKGDYCTLIRSPQGFKDNGAHKQFSFDNGGLVEYHWEIRVADNKQDLMVMLKRKELRKEKAKPLLEGNVTGMVCINNGMDCIISKMEETESLLGEGAKLQRKGEIGAFYGLLANKSSYDDTGSHIDMTGMSMMGGIGIGWKGLVTGAFGEYGTGNSDIASGLCSCEKKSEGKSKYVGGGLLGRYNVCEDEFSETKLYGEAILRAGQVSNTFNSKEAKDGAEKECKYNDETTMYGGCALGGGYKHKVGEKIDVDWSLRYMFGYQDGKDVEKPVDAYGNKVKLESVTSSRIRVGVRGKYVELEKVKPYIGIWYEHELSGKVKGAIQNGVDNVGDIPATSFEGGTGIGELGVSVKVGKLDVGISGQGYLGVRKGFGGILKLKYAFGKGAHAKPPKP